ncbi:MAG: hypothetical protein H6R19_2009 [Proteobacteria bacterium]|nr:hypothetical protein [Pseudomonadota bacterium]
MVKEIHPAVFVTAGFFLILLLQTVAAGYLPWWTMLAGTVALVSAPADWRRILRRLRFIFLALLILFAWQTPGTMILPALGSFSPTWDGLRATTEPALRLLAIVSVVALMLRHLSIEDWVNSLFVLVFPLRLLGLDPERFAVRLRLVLDYVERRDLNWRNCLDEALEDPVNPAEETWSVHHLGWQDRILLSILGLLLAGWLLW